MVRYSFPVELFHSQFHAGLARRTLRLSAAHFGAAGTAGALETRRQLDTQSVQHEFPEARVPQLS